MSSYLFIKAFRAIVEKGIDIKPLFDSAVFCFQFDFDDWPMSHPNPTECLRPYAFDGIFDIRSHYRAIFPEPEFAEVDEDSANADKQLKFSKLRY